MSDMEKQKYTARLADLLRKSSFKEEPAKIVTKLNECSRIHEDVSAENEQNSNTTKQFKMNLDIEIEEDEKAIKSSKPKITAFSEPKMLKKLDDSTFHE
jgi:hypothetical protein